MKCPFCKEILVILELQEVEIDYCMNCKGIWLDKGELDLMIEDELEKAKLFQSFIIVNDSKEKELNCPLCNVKMEKVRQQEYNIVADKCVYNHGFWFDKGELEEIIKTSSEKGENRFSALLKELITV